MFSTTNFSDIQTHWAKPCILQLAENQIVQGYPDDKFRPDKAVTRAEFAALLMKAFSNIEAVQNSQEYTDLSNKHWAYKAIKFATERQFFTGYPDGTFKPNEKITRLQNLLIFANHLNVEPNSTANTILPKYFDDVALIPNYAKSAITVATEYLFVVNYPNVKQLRPNQSSTRGEVAALFCQVLQYKNVIPSKYVVGNYPLAIPAQFDEAENFSDGVAWVKTGIKWGLIDKTGKVLIKPSYYFHEPFSSGLGLVTIGGKYRYINKTGKIVIALNLERGYSFAEGLAAVKINGKYGYINLQGKIVIQPQFESANSFAEGLAAVKINGKYGYINPQGKFVISPQFNWVYPFTDGVAWVGSNRGSGFIDKTNQFTSLSLGINDTLSDATGYFANGLARISVTRGDGFIDKTGKFVIQPRFKWAQQFSEGLSAVYDGSKIGFINTKGKVVIPLKWFGAESFQEGLAKVNFNRGTRYFEKIGYIDKDSNFVIIPQFDAARSFADDMAIVGKMNNNTRQYKWGYIRNPLK